MALRHEAPDGSYSLQVFVWPPGSRTRIHDHSSWGALCCAVGTVLEERYERLDDGSQRDHARLRKAWERAWGAGDGTSTVLPYDEGIHRVGNPGEETATSVHLYGPRWPRSTAGTTTPPATTSATAGGSSEQEHSQSR